MLFIWRSYLLHAPLVAWLNDISVLFLPDEGQVIFVYGADYGRRDQTTCSYKRPTSQIENAYCSNPTSKVADRYTLFVKHNQ